MFKISLIFLGAGAGGVMRYAVSGWAMSLTGGGPFPAGTLAVNLIGCLLIGVFGAMFMGSTPPVAIPEAYRVAILVGVLGGFTTFSSFGSETVALFVDGQYRLAVLNIILSNALCIAAAFAGLRAGQRFFGV